MIDDPGGRNRNRQGTERQATTVPYTRLTIRLLLSLGWKILLVNLSRVTYHCYRTRTTAIVVAEFLVLSLATRKYTSSTQLYVLIRSLSCTETIKENVTPNPPQRTAFFREDSCGKLAHRLLPLLCFFLCYDVCMYASGQPVAGTPEANNIHSGRAVLFTTFEYHGALTK